MFLGQAATVAWLLIGEEVVKLNSRYGGHTDTVALLDGAGILPTTPVVKAPHISDLFLAFRGEEVGEDQQATGQSRQHQHLTSSEEKVLETFFSIFQIPDVTVDLRDDTETGGQGYDEQRQPFPFGLSAELQIEVHVEVPDDAYCSCK